MSEITRIHEQLRRAYEGGAWHGPSLREALDGVTAEQAAAHPLAEAHSIWEIVLHLTVWADAARGVLEGAALTLDEGDDWPLVDGTDVRAWQATQSVLAGAHARLLEVLSRQEDAVLERPVEGRRYDVYVLLHGIIQHLLYHTGQIVLLGKERRAKGEEGTPTRSDGDL